MQRRHRTSKTFDRLSKQSAGRVTYAHTIPQPVKKEMSKKGVTATQWIHPKMQYLMSLMLPKSTYKRTRNTN